MDVRYIQLIYALYLCANYCLCIPGGGFGVPERVNYPLIVKVNDESFRPDSAFFDAEEHVYYFNDETTRYFECDKTYEQISSNITWTLQNRNNKIVYHKNEYGTSNRLVLNLTREHDGYTAKCIVGFNGYMSYKQTIKLLLSNTSEILYRDIAELGSSSKNLYLKVSWLSTEGNVYRSNRNVNMYEYKYNNNEEQTFTCELSDKSIAFFVWTFTSKGTSLHANLGSRFTNRLTKTKLITSSSVFDVTLTDLDDYGTIICHVETTNGLHMDPGKQNIGLNLRLKSEVDELKYDTPPDNTSNVVYQQHFNAGLGQDRGVVTKQIGSTNKLDADESKNVEIEKNTNPKVFTKTTSSSKDESDITENDTVNARTVALFLVICVIISFFVLALYFCTTKKRHDGNQNVAYTQRPSRDTRATEHIYDYPIFRAPPPGPQVLQYDYAYMTR